jgi:uncharacterized protein with ParB-like and HNH nuclease domain
MILSVLKKIFYTNTNQDEYHYMGYLVLQEKDDSVFSVIDGQQRHKRSLMHRASI